MEFPFDINNLVGDEVSKFDSKLVPYRSCPGSRKYHEQFRDVVDKMGEASAKAQGLRCPITAADRMKHTDQLLYVMKEREGNNGNGCALGILKIGQKKLFVYDNHGIQHEMEPLCVLDFYVHESRQRQGCGRRLFDYMLQDQNVRAAHLAIDRPSHKFLQFLQKHYQLKVTVPQVNNFVIFNGFFSDRKKGSHKMNTSRQDDDKKAPFYPYKTPYSNHIEENSVRNHREQNSQRELLAPVPARQPHSEITHAHTNNQSHSAESNGPADASVPRLGGMSTLYSRHTFNPTPPLPSIGQQDKPASASSYPANQHNYQDRRGHLRVPPHSLTITTTYPCNVNQPALPLQHTQPETSNTSVHNTSVSTSSGINQPANFIQQGESQRQPAGLRLNAYERQLLAEHRENSATILPIDLNVKTHRNDVLLPSHFTPYADLKLPNSGSDQLSRGAQDTSWNVFGVVKTQPVVNGYASPQRFQNTRPW